MGYRFTIDDALGVLGVSHGAPLSTIRRAFRRLALRHHPDRNPDDPGAAERFRNIFEAYRVLVEHHGSATASAANTQNPFAPKPNPEYPFVPHENKMHAPTAAEIAALDKPVRFRPAKWLGWFCGILLIGTLVVSILLERAGVSVGPAKSWVPQFLRRTARPY